jgi:cellulose 1,4-beta-cellobiosidase
MVSSKMKTYGASAPFNTSQFLSSTPTIVITTTVVSPPSAPTSLTSNVSGSTVVLNWTASSGATAYNVYRGSTSGSETLYASGIGATTYTDLGVASGRTYFYYVTATNTAGGSSASNEVSAVLKPDPPTGVTATGRTTSIAVAWAASSGATGYNVYRSTTSGSGYTGLGTGISTLSYVDSTALDGVMYYYVVKASNSGGTSGYSSEASAKTTKSSATKILVGFPGGIRRL